MKKLKQKAFNVLNNKRGQGMVEYILLLVIVVALVMAFKGKIMKAVGDKSDEVASGIETFKGE